MLPDSILHRVIVESFRSIKTMDCCGTPVYVHVHARFGCSKQPIGSFRDPPTRALEPRIGILRIASAPRMKDAPAFIPFRSGTPSLNRRGRDRIRG